MAPAPDFLSGWMSFFSSFVSSLQCKTLKKKKKKKKKKMKKLESSKAQVLLLQLLLALLRNPVSGFLLVSLSGMPACACQAACLASVCM
jgi:cytochrome b561